jgi:hypothetical protein
MVVITELPAGESAADLVVVAVSLSFGKPKEDEPEVAVCGTKAGECKFLVSGMPGTACGFSEGLISN